MIVDNGNDNARRAENECVIVKIQKMDLILLGRVHSISTAQNFNLSGTTAVDPTYGFETTVFALCSRMNLNPAESLIESRCRNRYEASILTPL